MSREDVALVLPTLAMVPRYVEALERGWSPRTVNRARPTRPEIDAVVQNAERLVAGCDCRVLAPGADPRSLRSWTRWIWDGDFCGWISARWQPGTPDLPPNILGHVGFAVVDWRQGRGLARWALATVLGEFADLGLPFIEATADEDNVPSRRVIERCGGAFLGRFALPAEFGGAPAVRYRVPTPGEGRR